MITHKIIINNPLGIHAAYAATLSAFVRKQKSYIFLRKKTGNIANACDMVAILGLLIKPQEELEILVDGINEDEDMKNVINLIKNLDT